MSKQDPMDVLRQAPEAAELLSRREELAGLLRSEEAKTLAGLFQRMGGPGLREAAESAAAGDGEALAGILRKVASDPKGAKAMADMDKKVRH